MTSITTRAGKGSPLTHNEVDANFTNLNNDKLDTAGIALGSAASPTLKFTGDPNTGIFSPGADQLAVATNGGERLRITSAGLVGIGTSAPSDMLSIVKIDTSNSLFDSDAAIAITNPNSDTFGRSTNLNFNQGTDASIGRIASIASVYTTFSTSVGGALAFSTNNGSGTVGEKMRITSTGNVGIGTTSPTTLLDVNADTVRVRTARTPASASATGATGEICWDANYIYVCTATNTWRRTAISSW